MLMVEGNMGREVTYFQPTQHSNQQIELGYKQARQEGGKFSFFLDYRGILLHTGGVSQTSFTKKIDSG